MKQTGLVKNSKLSFRVKKAWFADILNHAASRQFLWSLYYAGEAYVELHPDGVFISNLPEGSVYQKQLTKHLEDETRHAEVFKKLLAKDGLKPIRLKPHEDIGWFLLNQIVPDVVACSKTTKPFDRLTLQRYMAFLHALELRSITDLCALKEAAQSLGDLELVHDLEKILKDELFHASYTHKAVFELADSKKQAKRVLHEILCLEKKHMHFILLKLLETFEELGTVPKKGIGKLRWKFLKTLAVWGLALPKLPLYESMPKQILF